MKIKVKDPIIKRVIKKFVGRSNVGYEKYGVTLMDDSSNLDEWLNHLQEELMDAVNYIERAREQIDRQKKVWEEAMEFLKTPDFLKTPIDNTGQWPDISQPYSFKVCNCTMGCHTGTCCQEGLEE